MSDRYTVSENPFGYEADVGTARLRYALTDNRPDKIEVRETLEPLLPGAWPRSTRNGTVVKTPFRHICYGAHKEDLQALADAMNINERLVTKFAASDRPRWNTCGGKDGL